MYVNIWSGPTKPTYVWTNFVATTPWKYFFFVQYGQHSPEAHVCLSLPFFPQLVYIFNSTELFQLTA